MTSAKKIQNNIFKAILAQGILVQGMFEAMEIKVFVFTVEAFPFSNFMETRPKLTKVYLINNNRKFHLLIACMQKFIGCT